MEKIVQQEMLQNVLDTLHKNHLTDLVFVTNDHNYGSIKQYI